MRVRLTESGKKLLMKEIAAWQPKPVLQPEDIVGGKVDIDAAAAFCKAGDTYQHGI